MPNYKDSNESGYKELHSLVQRSCYRAGMLAGSDIYDLPRSISALQLRIYEKELEIQKLNKTIEARNDMESMGWLNRGG